MALNAGANYRLIRSLDPAAARLRRRAARSSSPAPRGRRARPYWGAYAASKAALEALALCYAAEVRHTAVRVNLVDPGPMRTRLRAQAYPGEDPARRPEPASAVEPFLALADPGCERHGERVSAEQKP